MVRIHPSAFSVEVSSTSEQFGPDHYMVENVVLVSIAYRDNVVGKLLIPIVMSVILVGKCLFI